MKFTEFLESNMEHSKKILQINKTLESDPTVHVTTLCSLRARRAQLSWCKGPSGVLADEAQTRRLLIKLQQQLLL